ncbi:MerC domain-containing protein [Arenicella xantha]|uniref:MerC mercury resistance protein n=1 Tax=Arenicella xantha TaxID=644221 RepID=A0A395JM74_9GAMM|nr:MerC domain-containing protein [Arenicella xantha]RBP52741.1 MerC mercury resistance protein [Arenicella xantha]
MLKSTSLDKLAIFLSGICLVHCLVAPILITLLPIVSLSVTVEEVLFHQLLLWLVIPTSVVGLFLGCRKHRRWSIVITGGAGMAILIAVATFGHSWFGLTGEKWVTTLGGLVLACSHFLNYRACQSITCASSRCETQHHH